MKNILSSCIVGVCLFWFDMAYAIHEITPNNLTIKVDVRPEVVGRFVDTQHGNNRMDFQKAWLELISNSSGKKYRVHATLWKISATGQRLSVYESITPHSMELDFSLSDLQFIPSGEYKLLLNIDWGGDFFVNELVSVNVSGFLPDYDLGLFSDVTKVNLSSIFKAGGGEVAVPVRLCTPSLVAGAATITATSVGILRHNMDPNVTLSYDLVLRGGKMGEVGVPIISNKSIFLTDLLIEPSVSSCRFYELVFIGKGANNQISGTYSEEMVITVSFDL